MSTSTPVDLTRRRTASGVNGARRSQVLDGSSFRIPTTSLGVDEVVEWHRLRSTGERLSKGIQEVSGWWWSRSRSETWKWKPTIALMAFGLSRTHGSGRIPGRQRRMIQSESYKSLVAVLWTLVEGGGPPERFCIVRYASYIPVFRISPVYTTSTVRQWPRSDSASKPHLTVQMSDQRA